LIFEKEKLTMSRFTTFGLTILLAFAPVALAVDGTVLINQSTITNGLTGCPTGGHFPIIICQSGSYRLSGNVTVPDANTDAIHINADNVTLDLNGFAILGPAQCTPGIYPIQCSTTGTGAGITSPNNNIALSNGTINGMGGSGVILPGFGTRIDGLRVSNNANASKSGIAVSQAVISNCTIISNAGSGISVGDLSIFSSNANTLFLFRGSTAVNQSTISFNGGFGINGNISTVIASNNVVNWNGQDGMINVHLAVNNTISFNAGFGFVCTAFQCSFEGNAFRENQGGPFKGGTSLGQNFGGFGVVF
jgi:hypothetical protein